MKKRVFSIIFLTLLSFGILTIFSSDIKAAPPEGFDYNSVLNLFWTDQEAISQEGEYHLVTDEIDGMPYSIPMLANWLKTADMGDIIGAFNSVDAIYPGHDVAYAYYIFMLDIEELHFYNYKLQLKKTVPFDELVSVTTEDPFVGSQTVFFEFKVEGQTYASQVVNKGDQLEQPEDPVKEYYIFDGWYKDQQFNLVYDFSDIVVRGFNLYAKFIPGNVRVNLFNGDNLYHFEDVPFNDAAMFSLITPNPDNYNKVIYNSPLLGAFVESSLNYIIIDQEIWNIDKTSRSGGYTMTEEGFRGYNMGLFSEEKFSNVKEIIVKFTMLETSPELVIKYSTDNVNWISSQVWTKTGTYSLNVSTDEDIFIGIEILNSKWTYIDNIKITKTLGNKQYIFDNWYYDQELTLPYKETDVFTADINLYAGYVEKKFELSFNSNDGSPITSLYYYEDEEIVIHQYNPSRIGYTFAGWYLDEEFEEELNLETMPGDDVVLYAKWEETEELQYLIEFYLGEELYTYIVLAEEQQLILPPAPPTEENQLFLGWYYDEEFTESFKVSDPIDDDIVLYGKFGADSGGNGGTELPPDDPTTPGTGLTFKKEYIFYVVLGVIVLAVVSSLIRKRK